MSTTHPLAITDAERPFLEFNDASELDAIRTALVDAGQPAAVAAGIVAFLLSRRYGTDDGLSAPTRSRYRKILRDLAGVDPDDRDAMRRLDAGLVTLRANAGVAVAAAGALLSLTGRPILAALAVPIIFDPPVTSSCADHEQKAA